VAPIHKWIIPDSLISLEVGKRFQTMRKHRDEARAGKSARSVANCGGASYRSLACLSLQRGNLRVGTCSPIRKSGHRFFACKGLKVILKSF
jgi:hypothetical protein